MTTATMSEARSKATKFGEAEDAYLKGFDRGFNCASWQDLPEVDSVVRTDSDGRVTVDEGNMWDVVQSLAYESESNDRQFSPFEFTAAEFNVADEDEESEVSTDELWEAFDEGISDGISANIQERMKAYQS